MYSPRGLRATFFTSDRKSNKRTDFRKVSPFFDYLHTFEDSLRVVCAHINKSVVRAHTTGPLFCCCLFMGIGSSYPALAVLALEVFHLPLVNTFWFNNRTQNGWSISLAYTLLWWLIRVGFDLGNPLLPITSIDLFFESVKLYAGWFVIFISLAVIVGWLFCILMDIREPIPFYAIFPSFPSYAIDTSGLTPCQTDLDTVALYDAECQAGLQRWSFEHIDPPYWHTLVGIVLQLFAVSIPAVLFWSLFTFQKYVAFGVPLAMKIIGYTAAGFFWYYRTDLYVWGPTKYNIEPRRLSAKSDDNSPYAFDPPMDVGGIIYRRTRATVIRNVLVIGLVDTIVFFILAGVLVFPSTIPTLSVVIGVGLALILFMALAVIIVAIFVRLSSPSSSSATIQEKVSRCRVVKNDHDEEQQQQQCALNAIDKTRINSRHTRLALSSSPHANGSLLLLTSK